MHIAICDNNIADRKHLERLLRRESDTRAHDAGVFHIDSFGQFDILFKAPMQYDLFFIDILQSDLDGYHAALMLRDAGVTVPIILCSSKVNYEDKIISAQASNTHPQDTFTQNTFLHLHKPFSAPILSSILDKALIFRKTAEPTIELRSDKDTIYVLENEIMYGKSISSRNTEIILTKQRTITILSNIENTFFDIAINNHFQMISPKYFVNTAHIKSHTLTKYFMNDGVVLKVSPLHLGWSL